MSDFIFIFMLWVCVTWICVCYFHTWTQFNLQLSFILYPGWGAADCQRSAVLLWLQLWGQTPLISENWIWVTTTCRTQEWRSCVVFYRVQPVDWRLWGQFTDFCRSHIYKTAFIHNLSHLILIKHNYSSYITWIHSLINLWHFKYSATC